MGVFRLVRLLAFDIDGTLAPHDRGSTLETREVLQHLESMGVVICLISGRPVDYVSGQARQLGLINPIVSGENGSIIYFGNDYPIEKEIKFEYTVDDTEKLERYKKIIKERYLEFIWESPNRVNYSFFLDENEDKLKKEIYSFTEKFFKGTNFEFYLHPDNAFDIVYKGINKGWGIHKIKDYLGCSILDIVTIGDGLNDVPMFNETYYSIGVGRQDTKFSVNSIGDAFNIIYNLLEGPNNCPKCNHKNITVWNMENIKKVMGECDKCEHTYEVIDFYVDLYK